MGDNFLGGRFPSFCLPFLLVLVDCCMVHCPFFCILCLVSFWVSLSISHFLFPLHGYAMNRGGVLVYSRRYPKYSRLTLLLYLSLPCS
jgi:hypothetical protein